MFSQNEGPASHGQAPFFTTQLRAVFESTTKNLEGVVGDPPKGTHLNDAVKFANDYASWSMKCQTLNQKIMYQFFRMQIRIPKSTLGFPNPFPTENLPQIPDKNNHVGRGLCLCRMASSSQRHRQCFPVRQLRSRWP